jgi:hypothetical protein
MLSERHHDADFLNDSLDHFRLLSKAILIENLDGNRLSSSTMGCTLYACKIASTQRLLKVVFVFA